LPARRRAAHPATPLAGFAICFMGSITSPGLGQARAIAHFFPLLEAVSFSDSYLLWAPDTLPAQVNTLIYVNDELGEDVQNGFANIETDISHPHSRK